jgi:sugar-specific transcriptional regulator TrmB
LATLGDLGLTVLQARTYVALLRLGRGKASQICLMMGIAKPEAYRILRELSLKGMVERSAGSPSTYRPNPPSHAIPALLGRLEHRFTDLRQKKSKLIRSLQSIESDAVEGLDERFDLIRGCANVLQKRIDMVMGAKQDYVSIISKYGLRRISGEELNDKFTSVMMSAKRRGLRIRMISEIDNSNLRSAHVLSRHVELRHLPDLLFYVDIVDKREMIIGPTLTDEEAREHYKQEDDIWTNNPRFVRAIYAMFEGLWTGARKYIAYREYMLKRDDSMQEPSGTMRSPFLVSQRA